MRLSLQASARDFSSPCAASWLGVHIRAFLGIRYAKRQAPRRDPHLVDERIDQRSRMVHDVRQRRRELAGRVGARASVAMQRAPVVSGADMDGSDARSQRDDTIAQRAD